MAIADLVILIWVSKLYFSLMGLQMLRTDSYGSVVVFGAWASWTDDYEEYVADTENKNYCAYEPMMYAFVILIIKWVGNSHF
jgi:hypothetical protein